MDYRSPSVTDIPISKSGGGLAGGGRCCVSNEFCDCWITNNTRSFGTINLCQLLSAKKRHIEGRKTGAEVVIDYIKTARAEDRAERKQQFEAKLKVAKDMVQVLRDLNQK